MLKYLKRQIRKLPPIMTREQVLNWYIDMNEHRWGATKEITSGELIALIRETGRKVEGQSKLAIHISPELEKEYRMKSKADLGQNKVHTNVKIPDSEKDKIQDMYWRCGMSLDKIAERYNCSSTTIRKKMKDWQIETRPRGTKTIASIKTQKTLSGDYIWSKKFA